MAKRNIEGEIEKLARLREVPATPDTAAALRKALGDRVNLVAAKAAQVAADLRLKDMIPDLTAAFHRLFQRGAEMDPQCWGKNAIAKALIDLDSDESAAFLQGCRYVQMEASYGGSVDTAVTLRSLCTLALVQCCDLTRADKLRHLVASACDPEETVRIDALRALEQMEGEEAALLLRLKAGMGDSRAAVLGQALESLLRLDGIGALEFAQSFLQQRDPEPARGLRSAPEEFLEETALALGMSRLPAALEVLKNAWNRQSREVFLRAISASRQASGFEFLLGLVQSGQESDAASALDALSLHRDSSEVRDAVYSAVKDRGGPQLLRRFQAKFGPATAD